MRLSALVQNQQREVISARKMSLERMRINTRHINSTNLQLPLLDYTFFFLGGLVPLKARFWRPWPMAVLRILSLAASASATFFLQRRRRGSFISFWLCREISLRDNYRAPVAGVTSHTISRQIGEKGFLL